MMILEGNLLEAAAILNPDSLSYNLTEAVEPLSVLGEFELPADVVVRLADKIVSANGFETLLYHFNESTVFQLESLKHILCGFSVDFIEMLIKSATDKRSLLHCFGLLRSCENRSILESLAKQVNLQELFFFTNLPIFNYFFILYLVRLLLKFFNSYTGGKVISFNYF